MQNVFWADQIAAQTIERAKKENNIVTCRSGASPSGSKHIGNLYDVLKSYIVYKAVKKQNYKARFVLTSDDRDPLRKIPSELAGLDGMFHKVEDDELKRLKNYLGVPYVNVPDPFNCCKSWAEHFNRVWLDGIIALGIDDIELYENDSLYIQGKFKPYITEALKNLVMSKKIMKRFQRTLPRDFIPFNPICEKCGKITAKPISFDLDNWTVKYSCKEKELMGKYEVKGCGYKGETSLDNGKLPWRFEWPSQWGIFHTTFEAFGKEHYEGSWQSGQDIAKKIYKIEPPIPHVYEFLLINGKKMSASVGNVFITQQILEILEPEVFFYFYTKKSKKQRDFDIKHIDRLVNEFDLAEMVYFGKETVEDEKEKTNLIRMYESSMQKIPNQLPLRIPYKFATIVANVYQNNLWKKEFIVSKTTELLKTSGIVADKIAKQDKERIYKRILLVNNWIEKYNPDEKVEINEKLPEIVLTENEIKALKKVRDVLDYAKTEEELYNEFYNICKSLDMDTKRFFAVMYKILINNDHGPRLAPFIFAIGRDKIKKLLEGV